MSARRSRASRSTQARGDLGDALELASKLAARSGDAQVLVATDAALATQADGPGRRTGQGAAGRPRAQEPGDRRARRPDVAVGGDALGVRQRRQPRSRGRAAAALELWGDDRLLEVRDVRLDAQARADVIIDDIPRDVRTVEVRLVGARPGGRPRRRTSWPSTTGRGRSSRPTGRELVLVVGEGDPYLETALSYLPERRAVRRDAR